MTDPLGLVRFQSSDFQDRLASALAIADAALKRAKRPYIAFSSGKDSVALTGIVHMIRPDVELAWSDDELEYPETVEYFRRAQAVAGDQLRITLGWGEHAGWFRPWTDEPLWREPFPGSLRIDQPVDDWMGGLGYDLTFTGLRMEENKRRRSWLVQAGHTYRVNEGTGTRCCPLWDWSASDVDALIAGWRLAYNPVYDTLERLYVPRKLQRLGPLPLARRQDLAEGWPELLERLEARYGQRWRP